LRPFRNPFRVIEGQETLSFVSAQELTGDRQIDITSETCPMTFVRTRLALDRMASGETLLIRLRGEEPRRNIPKTAAEQGHTVLAEAEAGNGTVLLLLRKG
jgi:tRNA 2-thiouridine synthesizing protein A